MVVPRACLRRALLVFVICAINYISCEPQQDADNVCIEEALEKQHKM